MKFLVSTWIIALCMGIRLTYAQDGNVFTYHRGTHPVVAYYTPYDNSIAIKFYPNRNEHNAGICLMIMGRIAEEKRLILKFDTNYFYLDEGTVAVNTRNFDGQPFTLHHSPSEDSEPVASVNRQQTVPVFDIVNGWLYVKAIDNFGNDIYGWLSPGMQCNSPYTTCP